MAKAKKTDDVARTPIEWRSEDWPLDRFLKVKRAGFNPKTADPEDVARIAESYRTFGIGRAFTVRDDELLLDGHQSLLALELLLSGQHKVKGKVVAWQPPEVVPVRVVSGMSDAVARAFIAAVTRNRVDTDHEKFAQLILDLHRRVEGTGEDVDALLESLNAIGLSPGEYTDYVDLAMLDGGDDKPRGAPPSAGVPKLTLEFTDPAIRDKVKRKLSENAKSEREPAGNVLARILSEWQKKAPAQPAANGKPAKRARC